MTGGWITLNSPAPLGVAYPLRFCFCKGWGFFALSSSYLPIFQALIIPVRMISKKYIDMKTISCYSFPCLPSSNADPIPWPHSLPPCSQP